MFSLWEFSTDNVVAAAVVVSISLLAIAWLLAGRRRPAKHSALEQRRLAGREAEVFIEPAADVVMAPPPEAAATEMPDPSQQSERENQWDDEVAATLPVVEAPQDVDLQTLPPPVAASLPTVSSPEKASAISIAAALVRHDKREAPPSTGASLELPLENVDAGGDDLTAIDGIDDAMAKEMNELGIRYFDQIVEWSPDHAAWIQSRLSSSVTNAQRTAWVAEAKTLIEQSAPSDRSHAEQVG